MATYNSLESCIDAVLKKMGLAQMAQGQAVAKAQKWLNRIDSILGKNMARVLRSGSTYPGAHKMSALKINGTNISASVSYQPVIRPSFCKNQGPVDLTKLFETGYRVKPGLPYSDIPYVGWRPGSWPMRNTFNQLVGAAAADGVTLTLS